MLSLYRPAAGFRRRGVRPHPLESTNVAKTKASAEIPVSRRAAKDRRDANDRRHQDQSVKVERRTSERRKVARRRQIDPTTCERDYSDDEIEFMHAMDAYKRANGRMFPTCSEILEVICSLGYVKVSGARNAAPPVVPASEANPE
jgi:hypothetical protein